MSNVTMSPKLRVPRFNVPTLKIGEHTVGLLFLAGLTILAGSFFYPVFDSWSYLLPPLAGAVVIAAFAAYLCDFFEIRSGEGAVVQLVSAVVALPGLLGLSEARFGLPFPAAIAQLVQSIAAGPARLLTTPVPAKSGEELLVAPVVTAWLGFAIAWILLRNGRVGLSLLGPVLAVIGALAFGVGNGAFLLRFSVPFLGAALIFLVTLGRRTSIRNNSIEVAGAGQTRTRLVAGAVLLAVSATSALIGANVPHIGRNRRFSLRDFRTPPFDPNQLASPLAEFSKYLRDDYSNEPLFTATGALPDRWRLATLTKYDGRVWGVGSPREAGKSGARSDGSDTTELDGVYQLVGEQLQSKAELPGKVSKTTIQIGTMREPWLPTPGRSLKFDAQRNPNLGLVRYNDNSDTLVNPKELLPKASYNILWSKNKSVPASELLGRSTTAAQPDPAPSVKLSAVGKWADEKVGEATGFDAVLKLRDALNQGFYVSGKAPGHAIGDLYRMTSSANSLQGNGEHYAALLGVLLRSKGIASRVVVGFVPKTDQTVNGVQSVYARNVHAWVEVQVQGAGWVPVESVQDPLKKPKPEATKTKQVAEDEFKPPLAVPQAEPSDPVEEKLKPKEKERVELNDSGFVVPVAALVAGGVTLIPLAFLGLFAGAVALLKARRRSLRRKANPAASVSGAWEEMLERSAEAGQPTRPNMTMAEASAELFAEKPQMKRIVHDLSAVTERVVYSPTGVVPGLSSDAWGLVAEFDAELRGSSTRWQRLKRLANPKPLIQGSVDRAYAS
jgi:hypothetical protein